MKLVASMIVRNELNRYLGLVIEHLQTYTDEIRVLDDGSTDGSADYLREQGVAVAENEGPTFDEHEGAARQTLLRHTMNALPDWILAIDADEFVGDPYRLRAVIEDAGNGRLAPPAFTLDMQEVWEATPEILAVRTDGGWRPHGCPILFRVPRRPEERRQGWKINPKRLACGREPMSVRRNYGLARPTGSAILHFGWARESERRARYDRYVSLDGGKYHANSHIQSIMAPPEKIRMATSEWPAGLAEYATDIARRAAE